MDARALHKSIWQGIYKEVSADKIQLYIPFYFGSGNDAPLCLTWDRNGMLSDGGRTITELESRLGCVQPYMEQIHAILTKNGDCQLVSGRIIVKKQFQSVISDDHQYQDYLGGMNHMLKAISLISAIGAIPVCKTQEVKL